MSATDPPTPESHRFWIRVPRPLWIGLLVVGLTGAALLTGRNSHRADVGSDRLAVDANPETEDRARENYNAAKDDLSAMVERLESDFESDDVAYADRDGKTRGGTVRAATAEVLATWSPRVLRDPQEIASPDVPVTVLVWCKLRFEDGEPLWTLILFEEYDPFCERPSRRMSRLLPPRQTMTWRKRLSRWNDLSAVVVLFFDREPDLQDVLRVCSCWGEETTGSQYPLVEDDREPNKAWPIYPLRPHVVAGAWERRIGPTSELPQRDNAP